MDGKLNLDKIIAELAQGKSSSLDELFYYYYPRLYNFSKTFLKSEDGIDDVLQEVFIKIWQNRENIKSKTTFNAYIYTITRNLLFNELRSRLNNQKTRDELEKLSVAGEYESFGEAEFNDLKEKIEKVIDELPPRQREIFKLSRTEGLSHKEIADKLKITAKTVEYHITQSTSFIKQKLRSLGIPAVLYFYLFF